MSDTDYFYPSYALASEQAFGALARHPDPGTTFGD